MLTTSPLMLQYNETLPFPTYYNNKEPILTSILILFYTPNTYKHPPSSNNPPHLHHTHLPPLTTPPTQPANTPSLPPTVTLILLGLHLPPTQSYYTDGSFTPLDGIGKGNIAGAGVFNGPLQVNIVAWIPQYSPGKFICTPDRRGAQQNAPKGYIYIHI
jgi:hypothetical protein